MRSSSQQVEDRPHLIGVSLVDGEAQPDLDARLPAVADPLQGLVKGPLHPPEAVVDLFQPVQADPHIGETDALKIPGLLPGDQGPVGGDHRPHPLGYRVLGQLRQVRPHQRLAAGKEHHRSAEPARSSIRAFPSAVVSSSSVGVILAWA